MITVGRTIANPAVNPQAFSVRFYKENGAPPVSVTRSAPNGASLVSTIPPPLLSFEEWAQGERKEFMSLLTAGFIEPTEREASTQFERDRYDGLLKKIHTMISRIVPNQPGYDGLPDAVWGLIQDRSRFKQSAHDAEVKLEHLNDLIYAPGEWKCEQCGFSLIKKTLYVQTGQVGMDREEDTEGCPNDGSWMKRVTWKEIAVDLGRQLENLVLEKS